MRRTKREIIAAEASGDEDMLTAKSILLRRQREEYAKFSKEAGLLTQNERTQVYGFGKSVAQKARWKAQKALDNGGGSGIIEVGNELSMNALTRKEKPNTYIEPMPKKQLQRIVKAFKANGGLIQMDNDTDEYLKANHAEAITYNSTTILLKQRPSRASVFEELIHATQYRKGENNGSYLDRLKCEIAAQKKLLKHSKVYKLTEPEIKQTKSALEAYEAELNEYYKNGGV